MPTKTQQINLESLEYEIERYNAPYLVRVSNVQLNSHGNVNASLHLSQDKHHRRPFLFITTVDDNDVFDFDINKIRLNYPSFKTLLEKMNDILYKKYHKEISSADAKAFFLRTYKYYKSLADNI